MNNRAAVIIFSFLVVVVLGILLAGFFVAAVSESNLTKNYIQGMHAFWTAEAGIAKALDTLDDVSGNIGQFSYEADVNLINILNTTINGTEYHYYFYNITSTGYAGNVQRRINTIAKRETNFDAGSFKYSLESTVDIVVKGSVDITGDNGCSSCTGNSCSCTGTQCCKENSTLNFPALFGKSKAELESYAESLGKKYTPSTLPSQVSGLVWVEGDLNIASNNNLSTEPGKTAILIVEGNARFSGNINFDGIIYVIGKLTITGTVNIDGAVMAESQAETDTDVRGNVTLNRNGEKIADALDSSLPETSRSIVCWWEL